MARHTQGASKRSGRQIKARDFAAARGIEQTKLDAFGVRGEDREIGPQAVPGGAQRIR